MRAMFVSLGIIVLFLCDLTGVHIVTANGCCSTATQDSAHACRDICLQLSTTDNRVQQISLLASAPTHCSESLMEFWKCAELSVFQDLETFSGRTCCNLTKTKDCRETCFKAQSEADINRHCSQGTEDVKLYDCIARQQDGEKCCGKANSSDGLMCKASCWNMYLTNSLKSSHSIRQLRNMCTGRNKEVLQCLLKQTRTTRQDSNTERYIHCCEYRVDKTCKDVCFDTLKSDIPQDDKIDKLMGACGKADIMDPLYQCLLKEGNIQFEDIDSAKLHCCEKAESKRCASLCVQTHSDKWTSIHKKFESLCGDMSSPIFTVEPQMHACLKDVEEPCHLGCSGLQYCTNMNNRPTQHFRSCTLDADKAAFNDIRMWQNGEISLPSLTIPVKDISSCEPEMWKAIACLYQIKPCYKKPTPPQICREDCEYILNKCVDTTRLQGQIVTEFCKRLTPISTGDCTSIKHYTVESLQKNSMQEVTYPCQSNPCKAGEVCIIYRRKCRHSSSCPHYICRKGCKMGQVSKVLFPIGTNAIIPVYKNGHKTPNCIKYKVCQCTHLESFGKCHEMKCMRNENCTISTGVFKEHGEHYMSECNDCVCYSGGEVCTKRQCSSPAIGNRHTFTELHGCECTKNYSPVCAANGKTYPSACIAHCAGQDSYQTGSCYQYDPCQNSPCEAGYRCVPSRQVCIGHKTSPCLQYLCLVLDECNELHHDPVCDSTGVEYTNHCMLLSKGKLIGYQGHCMMIPCLLSGVVCGHDGETYINECAALAAHTTLDYQGPCKTINFSVQSADTSNSCETVECFPIKPVGCEGIVPPWSCCPVCAAQLRILSSESLAYLSVEAKKGPVSVGRILGTLSMLLSVSECDVYGYLGLDGDIIVLVKPVMQTPTAIQVNACIKEAERLEYLIQSRSPTVKSNLLLTSLLYANLTIPVMTMTSGLAYFTQPLMVTVTLVLVFTHRILGIV